MHCPFCFAEDTKVIDSRLIADGLQVRRRRQCAKCQERFTSFESAELMMPKIIKNSGDREPFDEQKLRRGIQHALEKRPVKADDVEQAIGYISHQLSTKGEREISSKLVGKYVMDELKKLDKVAYIRFASVYLSFEDINEFIKEIEKIRE